MKEVTYMGHKLTKAEIKPDEKVMAIGEMPNWLATLQKKAFISVISTNKNLVVETAKKLFFSGGMSTFGPDKEMTFGRANFNMKVFQPWMYQL